MDGTSFRCCGCRKPLQLTWYLNIYCKLGLILVCAFILKTPTVWTSLSFWSLAQSRYLIRPVLTFVHALPSASCTYLPCWKTHLDFCPKGIKEFCILLPGHQLITGKGTQRSQSHRQTIEYESRTSGSQSLCGPVFGSYTLFVGLASVWVIVIIYHKGNLTDA